MAEGQGQGRAAEVRVAEGQGQGQGGRGGVWQESMTEMESGCRRASASGFTL